MTDPNPFQPTPPIPPVPDPPTPPPRPPVDKQLEGDSGIPGSEPLVEGGESWLPDNGSEGLGW
jgi:hypothetical protein